MDFELDELKPNEGKWLTVLGKLVDAATPHGAMPTFELPKEVPK